MSYADDLAARGAANPDTRARFTQGHHPRQALPTMTWLQPHENGTQFFRASDQLIYRVDIIDGMHQVHRADTRDGREQVGKFGPPLHTWLAAKTLVEADAEIEVRA
jgi:hypothetical protein